MTWGQNTTHKRTSPASSAKNHRLGGISAEVMGPRILFMLAVLVLVLFGLVMVFSASTIEAINEGASPTAYVWSQLRFAALGVVFCAIAAFIPYRVWLGPLTTAVWAVAMILLLLTALFGTEELGAQRWLSLGPISLQPSEFAKIALLLVAVRMLTLLRDGQLSFGQLIGHVVLGLLIPLGFMLGAQSDFGTTAICAVSIITVLWIAEVPMKYILLILIIGGSIAVFSIVSSPYRLERMTSFLNPWGDGKGGLDSGYQLIRSFYAFAEGGIFGVGLGNSHEKFLYLPEAETDFIFAIIGEELGMLGALFVIALFIVLLFAGMRIGCNASDKCGAMIACGLTTMLVFQAFLNIACVIGMAPTTGKPLPFISAGGSSLIASLIMVGLVLSVSRDSGLPDIHDQRRADLRIVRAENPFNVGGRSNHGRSMSTPALMSSRGRRSSSTSYGSSGSAGRRTSRSGSSVAASRMSGRRIGKSRR